MKRLCILAIVASQLAFSQWVAPPTSAYTTINTFLASLTAARTGAGAPGGTCTAGKDFYVNSTPTPKTLYYCSATDTWVAVVVLDSGGAATIGTTVIDPTTGVKAPIIACVGAPGNTTGPYGSLCEVRATGALWSCTNSGGCTTSGHWTAVSSGGATIASTSALIKGDGAGNGVAATAGTDYLTPAGCTRTVSGTTDTLSAADWGCRILYTSATAVTVTVPAGLTVGFYVELLQTAAGTIVTSPVAAATCSGTPCIVQRQALTKTAGLSASMYLTVYATNTIASKGDLQP